MTYDERKRVIALWLEPRSDAGFLARFKLPSLPETAIKAELVEMVEMLAENLPILPDQAALMEFLGKLGREVGKRAKTRGWPMQSEFIAAIEAVRSKPAPLVKLDKDEGENDPLLSRKIDLAHEWFRKFERIPNWWNTEAVCVGLIKARLCTYEELKAAHAAVPMRADAAHLGAMPVSPKRFGGDAA